MPRDVWSGMCRIVQEQMPRCDCIVATPDYCLAEDAGSRMFHWLRDSYGYDIREAAPLADIPEQDIIKFTVYHKSACEEMCAPLFTRHGRIKRSSAAGTEWMDCNPLGANKGTAIEFVQTLRHSPEETCTFGDNLNDIEMLQNSGRSFRGRQRQGGSHRRGKRYLCALLGKSHPSILKTFFITKKNRVHPAAVPAGRARFFSCRCDGLCHLQEIAAAHPQPPKFRSSIGRVNGICDDSCLFRGSTAHAARMFAGDRTFSTAFCVSLGRPMGKTGPRKPLSQVSAAVS